MPSADHSTTPWPSNDTWPDSDSESNPVAHPQPPQVLLPAHASSDDFRNLVALLCFLRTINDPTGYPSFPDKAASTEALPNRQRVIDAITTILVMKHEIVAAVSFNKPVLGKESPHLFGGLVYSEQDPVVLNSDDSEDTVEEEDEGDCQRDTIEAVTTFSNPHEEDNEHIMFSTDNSGGLTLLPREGSLWMHVRLEHFEELLQQ